MSLNKGFIACCFYSFILLWVTNKFYLKYCICLLICFCTFCFSSFPNTFIRMIFKKYKSGPFTPQLKAINYFLFSRFIIGTPLSFILYSIQSPSFIDSTCILSIISGLSFLSLELLIIKTSIILCLNYYKSLKISFSFLSFVFL